MFTLYQPGYFYRILFVVLSTGLHSVSIRLITAAFDRSVPPEQSHYWPMTHIHKMKNHQAEPLQKHTRGHILSCLVTVWKSHNKTHQPDHLQAHNVSENPDTVEMKTQSKKKYPSVLPSCHSCSVHGFASNRWKLTTCCCCKTVVLGGDNSDTNHLKAFIKKNWGSVYLLRTAFCKRSLVKKLCVLIKLYVSLVLKNIRSMCAWYNLSATCNIHFEHKL